MKIQTNIALTTVATCIATSLASCIENQQRALLDIANEVAAVVEDVRSEVQSTTADERKTLYLADAAIDGLEIPATGNTTDEQILRRTGYTTSYNKETKLPNWVAWHLTADHTSGPYSRKGVSFAEDEDVATPRATDTDYKHSGYDRGHMCPSGDNKWSAEAQRESFLFTNICPQEPNLNSGDWNEMEMQCRRWAKEYGDLYIVCGPILYSQKHKTIGRNRVVVPEAFFKVVLRTDSGQPKAIGFIYKNAPGNRPKGDYVNTVDEVERITGFDFFPALPDSIEDKVEAEANWVDWE